MAEIIITNGLMKYLILSSVIFIIGMLGIFLNRKNLISILMSLELMLLAVNINFVTFSTILSDLTGQIFVFFIFTVAAAEVAIGIAILINFFRSKGNISIDNVNIMRG